MELIYTLFENYSTWILLLVVFLAQLGVPLGSAFFLMWYGSTIDSTPFLLWEIPATVSAAVLGDLTAYSLGKRFSDQLSRAEKRSSWLANKMRQSSTLIDRYGIWIIWLTRFLATGLGPVVNYLLGSRKYPVKPFLLWVVMGEILFITELLYFGYRFKETWEDLLTIISDTGWLVVLVIISIWIVRKLMKKEHPVSQKSHG